MDERRIHVGVIIKTTQTDRRDITVGVLSPSLCVLNGRRTGVFIKKKKKENTYRMISEV